MQIRHVSTDMYIAVLEHQIDRAFGVEPEPSTLEILADKLIEQSTSNRIIDTEA